MTSIHPFGAFIIVALYLAFFAFVIFVIWQIVSALNRISKSVEDIAQTLRRMGSEGNRPQPGM